MGANIDITPRLIEALQTAARGADVSGTLRSTLCKLGWVTFNRTIQVYENGGTRKIAMGLRLTPLGKTILKSGTTMVGEKIRLRDLK